MEHLPIAAAERAGNRVELVRDLVIGGGARSDDPNYQFRFVDGWYNLAVDGDGNIYVADSLNYRVQVFDSGGAYVRTLGREGDGPGELPYAPRTVAIAGDRVVAGGSSLSRISEWSLAGDVIGRRDLGVRQWVTMLAGTAAGDLVGTYEAPYEGDDWRQRIRVARFATDRDEERLFFEHVDPPVSEDFKRAVAGDRPFVKLGGYRPYFALARDGSLYITPGDEYQLLATGVGGQVRWALRVAGPRSVPTEREHRSLLEQIRRAGHSEEDKEWFATATRQELRVVGPWPAISSIRVDGHGHVYVFPEVAELPGTSSERPVDVYAADGTRLFSGVIPVAEWTLSRLAYVLTYQTPLLPRRQGWAAALGDHIYRIEQDPDSEEDVVVRYRLVERFD